MHSKFQINTFVHVDGLFVFTFSLLLSLARSQSAIVRRAIGQRKHSSLQSIGYNWLWQMGNRMCDHVYNTISYLNITTPRWCHLPNTAQCRPAAHCTPGTHPNSNKLKMLQLESHTYLSPKNDFVRHFAKRPQLALSTSNLRARQRHRDLSVDGIQQYWQCSAACKLRCNPPAPRLMLYLNSFDKRIYIVRLLQVIIASSNMCGSVFSILLHVRAEWNCILAKSSDCQLCKEEDIIENYMNWRHGICQPLAPLSLSFSSIAAKKILDFLIEHT